MTQLYLTTSNEHWAAEVGEQWYQLSPLSIGLIHVINAIRKNYPNHKIVIDPNISENVWFKKHLKIEESYGLAPAFEDLAEEYEHPQSKECSRCRKESYYNASKRGYQCPYCLAIESFVNKGLFFSVRKRRKTARKKEYFHE